MDYYFINTDAASFGGRSPHNAWFRHGHAFAGAAPINGRQLERLRPGDVLLMYANKIGVLGVGSVLEEWDGLAHAEPLIYLSRYQNREYRVRVNWFRDLRLQPIPPEEVRRVTGWTPRNTLQRIARGVDSVQHWLADARPATRPPEGENYTLLTRSSKKRLDLLCLHVLARAYRNAWRELHACAPAGLHTVEGLDLLIDFGGTAIEKRPGRRNRPERPAITLSPHERSREQAA